MSDIKKLTRTTHVDPAWIDIYGHMNMAYYVKIFDDLGYEMLSEFGLGVEYTKAHKLGLFTVDVRIKYLREVVTNAPVTVSLVLKAFDDKRLWTELEMHHSELGYLAATMEQLAVHASLETRRATRFPDFVMVRLRSTGTPNPGKAVT